MKPTKNITDEIRRLYRDASEWLSVREVSTILDGEAVANLCTRITKLYRDGLLERRVGEGSRFEYRWNPGNPPTATERASGQVVKLGAVITVPGRNTSAGSDETALAVEASAQNTQVPASQPSNKPADAFDLRSLVEGAMLNVALLAEAVSQCDAPRDVLNSLVRAQAELCRANRCLTNGV